MEFEIKKECQARDFDEATQTVLNPMTGARVKVKNISAAYRKKYLPTIKKVNGVFVEIKSI